MKNEQCHICREKVAWTGIWVNTILVITKLIVGVTSGSKACIADGLHSASNIITALAISVTHRYTLRKANEDFQHGFGKAEFVAAGFVSLLILIGASILITVSIRHLLHEPTSPPHLSAIVIALVSIGANEMLFRYMRCVGTRHKSQTILANAWANRADCFSSLAVVIGVLGSRIGIPHLDPIAALVVVAVIVKISATIMFDSVKALMDVSVNHLYGDDIKDVVRNIAGVQHVSGVKTRHIGHHIWAEIDVYVDPQASLRDGDSLRKIVTETLLIKIPDLEKVMIHLLPVEK